MQAKPMQVGTHGLLIVHQVTKTPSPFTMVLQATWKDVSFLDSADAANNRSPP